MPGLVFALGGGWHTAAADVASHRGQRCEVAVVVRSLCTLHAPVSVLFLRPLLLPPGLMTWVFVHCSLALSDLNEHTVSRELHLDGVRDVQTAVSGCDPHVGLIDERSVFSPCFCCLLTPAAVLARSLWLHRCRVAHTPPWVALLPLSCCEFP